jgi:hypothetical protein
MAGPTFAGQVSAWVDSVWLKIAATRCSRIAVWLRRVVGNRPWGHHPESEQGEWHTMIE